MRKKQSKQWWEMCESEELFRACYQFPHVFLEETAFANKQEELKALKFNSKKFDVDYSREINICEMIIAGKYEEFKKREAEESKRLLELTIDGLKAEGHWYSNTTKGCVK